MLKKNFQIRTENFEEKNVCKKICIKRKFDYV